MVKLMTMGEMKDDFEFKLLPKPLYESKLLANATLFEDLFQSGLNHHLLGVKCWRCVAKGQHDDQKVGYYYVSLCYRLLDEDVVITEVDHFSKKDQKMVKRIKTIKLGGGKTLVVVH